MASDEQGWQMVFDGGGHFARSHDLGCEASNDRVYRHVVILLMGPWGPNSPESSETIALTEYSMRPQVCFVPDFTAIVVVPNRHIGP